MERHTAKLAFVTGVISLKDAILHVSAGNTSYGSMWSAYEFLTGADENTPVYEFHSAITEDPELLEKMFKQINII